MLNSQRFPFVESRDVFGDIDAVPILPLTLSYKNSVVNVSGLLDTGASINVLPYSSKRIAIAFSNDSNSDLL
jgi:hypothetical protein